jgi:hypothetical protein
MWSIWYCQSTWLEVIDGFAPVDRYDSNDTIVERFENYVGAVTPEIKLASYLRKGD